MIKYFFLLFFLYALTGHAQTIAQWSALVNWDGVIHWSGYKRTLPAGSIILNTYGGTRIKVRGKKIISSV